MSRVGGNENRTCPIALVLLVTMFWSASIPIAAVAAEPLALRKIMSDLGNNMQAVTDGLAREDYAIVDKAAQAIADHPQPPLSEKLRIIAFVGSRMAQFKAHDEQTHELALKIVAAARRQNAPAAIDAFHALQLGCHGCHQDFRKPFIEHFYAAQ